MNPKYQRKGIAVSEARHGFQAQFDDGNLQIGLRFVDVFKKDETKNKGITYIRATGLLGVHMQEIVKNVASKAEEKIEQANDGQPPSPLVVAKKGFGLAAKALGKAASVASDISNKYAIPLVGSQVKITEENYKPTVKRLHIPFGNTYYFISNSPPNAKSEDTYYELAVEFDPEENDLRLLDPAVSENIKAGIVVRLYLDTFSSIPFAGDIGEVLTVFLLDKINHPEARKQIQSTTAQKQQQQQQQQQQQPQQPQQQVQPPATIQPQYQQEYQQPPSYQQAPPSYPSSQELLYQQPPPYQAQQQDQPQDQQPQQLYPQL